MSLLLLGLFLRLSKALYRICLTHESELGSLVWGAGGAPEPAEPLRASRLQEEPPSLHAEREGDQEFP